jgi:hypothetical protein
LLFDNGIDVVFGDIVSPDFCEHWSFIFCVLVAGGAQQGHRTQQQEGKNSIEVAHNCTPSRNWFDGLAAGRARLPICFHSHILIGGIDQCPSAVMYAAKGLNSAIA